MRPLAGALERAGYRVVNIGHPSWRRRLPDLARGVAAQAEAAVAGAPPAAGRSRACTSSATASAP